MSDSNYRHKSGALKRKLKSERELKASFGRQNITKFFKSDNATVTSDCVTNCSENNDKGSCSQGILLETESDSRSQSTIEEASLTKDVEQDISENPMETLGIKYADPGTWPHYISDEIRLEIVKTISFQEFLNSYKELPKDVNGKNFQDFFLYSKTKDERTRHHFRREWLAWSASKEALYCLPCRIFCDQASKSLSCLAVGGFFPKIKPWKRLYDFLPAHENSAEHRKQFLAWKMLLESLKGTGIDKNIQLQIQNEISKYRALLKRIVDVTLFLSSRGLAFQGENSKIGDAHNGNFLGILELIGKYDEITEQHLNKVQKNQNENKSMKGRAHYLSWQSQNEFIGLCAEKVLQVILQKRKDAIFYGLIVDATPDISHIEQNVLILRYVAHNENSNEFEVNESFIEFMNFSGKTGEKITKEILITLEKHNIPLEDCRSQGYDNGANMRGEIRGVQSRILEKNKHALFSPCGAHSLNRIGVNAAKISPDITTFFGNIEAFYALFAHSPARWELLKKHVPLSVSNLSETRWSERIQAVRPFIMYYPGILDALNSVIEGMGKALAPSSLNSAKGLKKYFNSYKGLLMTVLWHKILLNIEKKNVIIQSKGISLDVEIALIEDLGKEIQDLRDSWENIVEEAKTIAESIGVLPQFPSNRKSTETPHDFKISVIYPVLDFILTDINVRFEAASNIYDLFSPILDFQNMNDDELLEKTAKLVSTYEKDLTDNLIDEITHLKNIYKTVFGTKKPPIKLINEIHLKNLESIFPNVCLAIKLFCTIPVTVASAERAFSRLGNSLKTWQRNSSSQERLNHLAILCIENDLAKNIDFGDVIERFASKKARKVLLK